MSTSVKAQINESLRDKLVGYFLHEVVPNSEVLQELRLSDKLQTANDLYQYLLLDIQVSQKVESSPVASALNSLQQYINAILMSMEPGYENADMPSSYAVDWRDQQSQYPLWAANQMIAWYPEMYIDPSLRLKKSAYFEQLETDINQNKIQMDTTQDAVKNYLASFEEIANLKIINGYVDSHLFGEGTYYFIGKSNTENTYYWRAMDMSERAYVAVGSSEGPKVDHPMPGAWSDWKKINLPISASALEHTIRPVYFNNRLFIGWVEKFSNEDLGELGENFIPPASRNAQEKLPALPCQYRVNLTYKKYDDSWSVPITYMTANNLPSSDVLQLILTWDTSSDESDLLIALYSGYTPGSNPAGEADAYTFLKTARVDRNFNITSGFPLGETVPTGTDPVGDQFPNLRICRIFSYLNAGRMQFKVPAVAARISSVSSRKPNGDAWNALGFQSAIREPLAGLQVSYDNSTSKLSFATGLTGAVSKNSQVEVNLRFDFEGAGNAATALNCEFDLIVDTSAADPHWYRLLPGSRFTALGNGYRLAGTYKHFLTGYFSAEAASESIWLTWSANGLVTGLLPALASGQSHSLANYRVGKSAIDHLLTFPKIGRWIVLTSFKGVTRDYLFDSAPLNNAQLTEYRFRSHNWRPRNLANPADGVTDALNSAGQPAAIINPPGALAYELAINRGSLLPDWPGTWPAQSKQFSIIHGIRVERSQGAGWQTLGDARIITDIELSVGTEQSDAELVAPRLNRLPSPSHGAAEFIDFTGSAIARSDDDQGARRPIRMNTLFARELINRANIALESLLSWETQGLYEPPLVLGEAGSTMDFNGANGLYFWELFLHLPFMVAHRLLLEQQFDSAETWLAFIFDPNRKSNASGRPDYWNVRPLIPEGSDPDHATRAPLDPDGIAASHPVRYQKAIYAFYLRILLNRGDAAYRQLTPDSLNEAKLWYVRCLDLLGPRPDQHLVSRWTPTSLGTLAGSTNAELRGLEIQMASERDALRQSRGAHDGSATLTFDRHELHLRTFGTDATLAALDTGLFVPPLNAHLTEQWSTLESRLYNLRNNLTIDGKPLALPLFAAPLDPRALLAMFASGTGSGAAGSLLAQATPLYRFNVLYGRAMAAVEALSQFGSTLLSLIERKEQAEFLELQHQQAWNFSQFAIDLQLQAQQVEAEARLALLASQQVIKQRAEHFARLDDEVVNFGEISAGVMHLSGRVAENASGVAAGIGGLLKLLPNIIGVGSGFIAGMASGASFKVDGGGHQVSGTSDSFRDVSLAMGSALHGTADSTDRAEQFRRRHEDWRLAHQQALLEVAQIDAQLKVHDQQARVTQLQLQQAKTSLDNAKVAYDLLSKRFTKSQLYQWLTAQHSTFYYQMYDAAVSMCLGAEAAWQFEIADFSTRHIQTNGWNDSYRGLTAGEALKLNLIKMDAAYLARNERLLEITRTVSVRQLLTRRDSDGTADESDWQRFHQGLIEGDAAAGEIILGQALYDATHPGHYLRRIKRIGMSLPVLLGPYQDVNAVLTQTRNAIAMVPTVEAVEALLTGGVASAGQIMENLRASQQIAVCKGVDDDGMSNFRFEEERYGFFEGTGAVCRLALEFPKPAQGDDSWEAEQRLALLGSLTDVILHVHFTARQGGTRFADQVRATYAENARKGKTSRKPKR